MIDYKILDDSIRFYEFRGFKRVEVPWLVTKPISDITKPSHIPDFTVSEKSKVLVASAEQSFLYQYNKGFLPKGQFQATTPCFREDQFDSFHSKYFIKNELIKTDNVDLDSLHNVIEIAFEFFKSKLGHGVSIISTGNNTYDILFDKVELGSYGIRSCEFLEWIYGTGVAEPRFSKVIEKYAISLKTNS